MPYIILLFVFVLMHPAVAGADLPFRTDLQLSNINVVDLRSGGSPANVVIDTARLGCDESDPTVKEAFDDTSFVVDLSNLGTRDVTLTKVRYIVRGASSGATLRTRKISLLELLSSKSTRSVTLPFTVARGTDDKVFFGSSQVVEPIGSKLVTIQLFDRFGKLVVRGQKTIYFAEVNRCQ